MPHNRFSECQRAAHHDMPAGSPPPSYVPVFPYRTEEWKLIVQRKQMRRQSLLRWKLQPELCKPVDAGGLLNVCNVPLLSGILSEAASDITEMNVRSLLADLASGHLTSEAVLVAFCKRASIAQQTVSSRWYPRRRRGPILCARSTACPRSCSTRVDQRKVPRQAAFEDWQDGRTPSPVSAKGSLYRTL